VGEAWGWKRWGSRQGCQRLDRRQRRGKKTPTLVSPGREAVELENSVEWRSAEAVFGRRENVRSPGTTARSLSLRGASPQRKLRERAGNARGAGARSSFGWQKSVGRIARLLHREVARPVGDQERALARKKFVAPLTRGANGQTAKRCACALGPKKTQHARPKG